MLREAVIHQEGVITLAPTGIQSSVQGDRDRDRDLTLAPRSVQSARETMIYEEDSITLAHTRYKNCYPASIR